MIRPLLVLSSIFLVLYATCQPYNYYFGNIHAHTSYSDGCRDAATSGISIPAQAFSYAKQSYNFHFLGISEHNHSGAGMHLADYAKGVFQADTSNRNGAFVCMYGMEYGVINNGGHVLIYGIDSLVGWENNNYQIFCGQFDYATLWKLVSRRPKAFATVAHPSDNDFSNLANTPYSDTAALAVVGAPIRSGAAFSTTTDYSDPPPATVYENYFRKLLARGYHVGASIDHDNHYTTFGRTTHSRTVVLAATLNRDSIMDAYKKRRFYASDDWNAQVNFTINAYPLGSVISTSTNPSINIRVTDADAGDNVSSIQLYYGVPGSLVLSTVLATSSSAALAYTHSLNVGDSYYYYAVITQADGDKIWTSPIWVTKTDVVVPLQVVAFYANIISHTIKLTASIANSEALQSVIVEKGYKGYDFSPIASSHAAMPANNTLTFLDAYPQEGYQFYRLKMMNNAGKVWYSQTLSVLYTSNEYRLHVSRISAGNMMVNIWTPTAMNATLHMYTTDGRCVLTRNVRLVKGLNGVNVPTVPGRLLYVVVHYEDGVERQCKVWL